VSGTVEGRTKGAVAAGAETGALGGFIGTGWRVGTSTSGRPPAFDTADAITFFFSSLK